MMRRRWWASVALALMTLMMPLLASAQAEVTLPPWRRELPPGRQEATMTVGESQLHVQLAIQPWEKTLGLGYRNGLEPETGMLFVNQSATVQTYWMKGMRFCLDIVWIENGQVVGAAENACPDPTGTADGDRARYHSGEPVTYILEVPAGWMAEHGYGPGTPVDLSNVPLD